MTRTCRQTSPGGDTGPGVECVLLGDKAVAHQPVQFVPRCGHFVGERVAEHLGYRIEQVPVHDRVLVLRDAERGVFVRNPRHDLLTTVRILVDLARGERGNGTGQSFLLLALLLVPAVEQVVLEFGMRGEHPAIEQRCDVTDSGTDGRKRRADDLKARR